MNNKDKLAGNNFNFTLNNYINNNFTSSTPSNSIKYRISKGKSYQQLHSSNKTTQGNLPYSNNNISTFIDKIGMNNSFISVTLHLIYRIPQIYKYFLNNVNSKSEKFSIHIHNIIVTCNTNNDNNYKIDLMKIKGSLFNKDNSFKMNEINDPIHLLNLIIKTSNLDEIVVFKNIKVKDLCDCSCSISFNIEKFPNIFDIPLNDILKISENHSNSLFYNKNRLISFYKSMIEHNYTKKLSCPLNGENCNYNRITRKILINPDESNNSKIPYIIFDYLLDNLNISMYNLLHSLILIPQFFELENLFDFEQDKDYDESEINSNPKYIFNGIIFRTKNKSFTCAFKKEDYWVYFDDNEGYHILNKWCEIISISLKNFLVPYILYYQIQNEDMFIKEEKITKEDLNYLENFANKWDEYKYHSSNRIKLYEFVNQTVRQNTDNIKFQEEIENKDDKYSNSNNSIQHKNPYKREKKSSSTNQRISSEKNKENNYLDYPLQININKNNNNNNNKTLNIVPKSTSHHNRKDNKTVINNNLKDFNINSGIQSVEIETAKSQNQKILYKEDNEDRIKPYQISTEHKTFGSNNIISISNKVIIPQIWVCSNCQRVNKAYEYKCQNCNIVNKNQKNIIEIYNRKSMTEDKNNNNEKNNQFLNSPYIQVNNYKGINNYNGNNVDFSNINNTNLNSAFKKVSCICYSRMSDKVIENGICKYCGRRVYNNNNYTMKNNNEIKIRPGTAISIRTNQKYSAENTNNDVIHKKLLNNTNLNKHRQISTNRYNDDTYDDLDDLIIKKQKNIKNINVNNNFDSKQNKRNELLNYKSNTMKKAKKKK